ncbi:hypothetical protein FF38_04814 [Lucilia cuprina]|uniref:Uncharacterized protein n=1 Tax=Lucilia cuprina TaxID=7375 RepID=A0A0L0BKQ0_LUCCU|nr:hypothetical protein FF38_04814 [Lucilia cuprina]
MPNTNTTTNSTSRKPTVSYTLFMYREELKRREARYLRLNKTKIVLTSELISKSVRNFKHCTAEDLKAITREMFFKKKLKKQIVRIQKLQNLGIDNANPNAQSTEL